MFISQEVLQIIATAGSRQQLRRKLQGLALLNDRSITAVRKASITRLVRWASNPLVTA